MIGYLHGVISHIYSNFCFIDVSGVGYRVYISAITRDQLNKGKEAVLLTYLQVREDAMQLYGFLTQEEYDLFMQLVSVSGIGPKVAIGVLSAVKPDEFLLAVSQNNLKFLTKLPGIGKKTAERLVLELKDKIGQIPVANVSNSNLRSSEAGNLEEEAVLALVSLGYHATEVVPFVRSHLGSTQSVEDLIRYVLKDMSGKQ